MLTSMQIRQLESQDLPTLKAFADETIGRNYFSDAELEQVFQKSLAIPEGIMCSFVLVDDNNQIQGMRLAFPPGAWSAGKGNKLRPDLWNVPMESVAYFQSLFVAPAFRQDGWGPKLSEAAIAAFKKLGAKAIVTHAWKESPHNSSLRYLTSFGFQEVATHPEYWINVDYECILDGKPCRCTAVEMIKYI